MQAWNQWGAQPAPGYQSYQPPPTGAPPPAPGAQPAYPLGYQYYGATPGLAAAATPDMTGYTQQQWNVVHQQHWQQWQQWHQQFQQWQQQYGDKYQESLNSLTAQSSTPAAAAPVVPPPPDMAHPPPLPPPDKSIPPPPPAEESDAQQQDTFRSPSKPLEVPTSQQDFANRATGTNFQTDRSNPPVQPPLPYYGVPPPSKGTPLPTEDFNKPPPPPPPSNYEGAYGNRGNAGDNFHPSKRPFEGETFREQYPGGDDAKKPRNDSFGGGYQAYNRGEDQGGRGRGRGGRWSAPHPIDEPDQQQRPGNKQSEGDSTPQPVRPPVKDNPDELSEAEKAFDVQFKQWEEQFNKWKEQNINHPDKTQYREYEAKWESWREQLLQRREQMRKKREASQKLSGSSDPNAESFPSDNSGRGGAARGRGGRGRGNFGRGGGRGGSNAGQDDFRTSVQDVASNRAFGSAVPSQEQTFGFREPKHGPGGSAGFGGSQDLVGKAEADSGPINFGFDSKIPVGGQKQESKIPPVGSNRGPADFVGPQQGPLPLGGFGVPPPPLGQPDPKAMPIVQNRSPGDFGGSPKTVQKPPSLLSPSHSNQFTPVPKLSGEEKIVPEVEKQEAEEEKTDGTVKLDFMKKSSDGIPGLDLLAGDEKVKESEKAAAEERELSVGHDTDDRVGEKSNHSNGSVGSNPKEPLIKLTPGFSKPPPFLPTFGPENQNQSNPGFLPANQNAPKFSPGNQGPKGLFNQGPGNSNFGQDMNKGPGSENQPNPNFVPGNQGPPNAPFGPGGHGHNFGPGGQDSQGFGPQNNMGQRGFGPGGNQGFGPFQGQFGPGPGNQGFGPNNNFGPGPRPWGDGMDGPNRSGWNQGPPRFEGPGKDNAPGMRDNFQAPRDNFQGMRDNFQGPMDGSQGPRDNFQGPRDNFFVNRDSFQGPRDHNFQGPRNEGFGNSRENLQGPRDNFQESRDNFQGQGSRDNFSGPGDRFLGPRDNFQGPKDRFSGPPPFGDFNFQGRDFPGESEFGRGGPHDFPPPRDFQEGGRGAPQDFGSEYGRGRMVRGRGRGRGGFGNQPPERGSGDDMNWQRRFGPEQPLDAGPPPQGLKGPGSSYEEDLDMPPDEKGLPPEGPFSSDLDHGRWERDGDGGCSRDPFARRFKEDQRSSGRNWGDDDFGASRFPREDRYGGDVPKRDWSRSEERGQTWDRSQDWDSNGFELEPATVVDYGHRPVSAPESSSVSAFPEAVQTFDYAHGASTRRSDVPPGSDPWRREDPLFRGSRDRDDRFHRDRDRDRERDRDRDRERERERERDRDRERERERDRDREQERSRERDRSRDDREWGRGNWDSERDFGKRETRWERDRGREAESGREDRSSSKWEDEDRYRNSGGDRWSRRDRERDGYKGSSGGRHSKNGGGGGDSSHADFPPPPDAPPPPSFTSPVPAVESQIRAALVEDLLCPPGRTARPARLVIMLRGPPGSGKTFVAKLIKDKEVEMGGSAPRILALDDYFMVEVEKEEKDPETGRKVITKVMEYEYEAAMEKHYRSSLLKAFRKTVNDGYFPFIIVDCVNHQVKHFEEMWSYAKQKGFQVYVCEMDMDVSTCSKRNIHNRTEEDIEDIIKNWEDTPRHYLRVDVRSLLQSVAITEVEMEDTVQEDDKQEDEKMEIEGKEEDSQDGDEEPENAFTSKWERMEPSGDKLNRLDGLAKRRKADDQPQTMEDWLQLTDDYDNRSTTPGKKRIRWADLEERREQEKMRAIGFVVGQTDWSRMTDPTFGEGALTQTKYI